MWDGHSFGAQPIAGPERLDRAPSAQYHPGMPTMTRQERYRWLDTEVLPALRKHILDNRISYRRMAKILRGHGSRATYERVRQWVEGEGFPSPPNAEAIVRWLATRE